MTQKVTTSLNNWQFQDQHVQQNLAGGDFIGSHSCILCATIPRMADLTDSAPGVAPVNALNNAEEGTVDLHSEIAIPIGVVDTAGINQARQIAQIFEIGSKRSYILAARTLGSMQIARVLYKGPSLLRMLYAYYPNKKIGGTGNTFADNMRDTTTTAGGDIIKMSSELSDSLPTTPPQDVPGYDNIIMNLGSSLFSQPLGLILYMKNNNDQEVAALFLEECYVENHGLSLSANSIIVAEQVSMRFERVVPIKVRVVPNAPGATIGGAQTSNWFNDMLQQGADMIASAGSAIGQAVGLPV